MMQLPWIPGMHSLTLGDHRLFLPKPHVRWHVNNHYHAVLSPLVRNTSRRGVQTAPLPNDQPVRMQPWTTASHESDGLIGKAWSGRSAQGIPQGKFQQAHRGVNQQAGASQHKELRGVVQLHAGL